MNCIQSIIFIVIIIWFAIFFGLMIEGNCDIFSYSILPKEIEKTSKLNIFGSLIMSIILFITCPLIFILRFFHWITHVKLSNKDRSKEKDGII